MKQDQFLTTSLSRMETTEDYIQDVKQILQQARQSVYSAVNFTMVQAYWLIGRRIIQQEQAGSERAAYGEYLLQELSRSLSAELGKGFSYANLRNFRQFYQTYTDETICYTVCSKLSWSHNRLIMRVVDNSARLFYLRESIAQQWSVRELERNIKSFAYHRVLSNQVETLPKEGSVCIEDFIRDPYTLEFLNIPQSELDNEKSIETAIINHLQKFLLEIGRGFSFVGRQYRISTETTHFYIDLVFYNYLMKCFVLFDLKTTKLTHQDIGQMDMYRRLFDDLKRPSGDNPTIGILLCAEKDETVVKYSVMNDTQQLFASKFLPYLPSEKELIQEIERNKRIYKEFAKREKGATGATEEK